MASVTSTVLVSPALVRKDVYPKAPDFFKRDEKVWVAFNKYLDFGKKGKIPLGGCRRYSPKLLFIIAAAYGARFSKESGAAMKLEIDGRPAEIRLEDCKSGRDHCFVLLKILGPEPEEWIIDKSWKQFAFNISSDFDYDPKDPYNKSLIEDCPDILICRRGAIKPLIRHYAAILRAQGHTERADALVANSTIWDATGTDAFSTSLFLKNVYHLAQQLSPGQTSPDRNAEHSSREFLNGWDCFVAALGKKGATITQCARRMLP